VASADGIPKNIKNKTAASDIGRKRAPEDVLKEVMKSFKAIWLVTRKLWMASRTINHNLNCRKERKIPERALPQTNS